MDRLRERLLFGSDFLLGVELVSTRGTMSENKAVRAREFSNQLAASPRIDWVSITDNAGGNPMLGPTALGKPLIYAGKEVVIHLSCKDFNRHGLESEAWLLASEGFHNILALSGDYPVASQDGMAKPVFDIDSIGLLTLLERMNTGLPAAIRGPGSQRKLRPTEFFSGAVVTNFKLRENEVMPQYLKLERKIACGAQFVINQIGYDSRKIHELIAYMRNHGMGRVPLIGNVYVLNPKVASLFRSMKIPGVVISEELFEETRRQGESPDRGKAFFRELAARQIAVYRGLGYRGAYLGGVHSYDEIERVLEIEKSFGVNDWKQFAKEIAYSRTNEFFYYEADGDSGLCNSEQVNREYLRSLKSPGKNRHVTFSYRMSKAIHDVAFVPGRGLAPLGKSLAERSSDPSQGPGWLRSLEHISKAALFRCRDCGDCSLPQTAFLCPESQCAKNQRNGPCGGTRDGKCEVEEFECIWSRAYERLKYDGRHLSMLEHAPAIQDQALRGTSSWANAWRGLDHIARADGEVSDPVAMREKSAD